MRTLTRVEREATYIHRAAFDGHATVTRCQERRVNREYTEITTIRLATHRVDIVRQNIRQSDICSANGEYTEIIAMTDPRGGRVIAERIVALTGCSIISISTSKY